MKKASKKNSKTTSNSFSNEDLRDFMEMFCMSVESGLSFVQACDCIARLESAPLSNQMVYLVNKVKIGLGFFEALCEVANEIQNPHFHRFAKFILVAGHSGGSPTAALRGLAEELKALQRISKMKLAVLRPIEQQD